ncbi:MAG: hypothetical protein LBO74_04180 [Candidatus Symbiothrix sp.]|jgi:hypothetical protein|nr:hypothetical protein [Candidatus Symbiothrix sp.]
MKRIDKAKHTEIPLTIQKELLLNGKSVAILAGSEFSKKEGITLTQQVSDYYNSLGGKVMSPVYGDIILDKQAVEDDFAHGVGRIKAIAFAAVPDVIKKGIIILLLGKHKKDEKILSAMIAAPITIGMDEYIGVVVIRQYHSGNKKLYQIPATNQGVMLESSIGSSNPAQIPATNQGNIAKILQNIISAKCD